jgi:HlyD family secretion protein
MACLTTGRLCLVFLLLLLFPSGCARRDKASESPLVVSGNLEAVDAQLGFKISGRVVERLVSEGDAVRKGQLIARLEDLELQQQLNVRKAELGVAVAALDELLAGTRPEEIAAAQAVLRSAEAERDRARLDFTRAKELSARNALANRDFELAEASLKVAEAHCAQLGEQLRLLQEGPRKETIRQARARAAQARAAVDLARTQVENCRLLAPMDGRVLSHSIEPGEFVSPGTPVVTVSDTVHLWVRAYVSQTELSRLRLGQKAEVRTDAAGAPKREGVLGFVSSEAEFTPKTVQTQKERVKLVYRVKVYVDNPDGALKPGMPADLVFP